MGVSQCCSFELGTKWDRLCQEVNPRIQCSGNLVAELSFDLIAMWWISLVWGGDVLSARAARILTNGTIGLH